MDYFSEKQPFIFTDDVNNSLALDVDDETVLISPHITVLQGVILSMCFTAVVMLLLCQLFVYVRASMRKKIGNRYTLSPPTTAYRTQALYNVTSSGIREADNLQSSSENMAIANDFRKTSYKIGVHRKSCRKTYKVPRDVAEPWQSIRHEPRPFSYGVGKVFMVDPRGM